MVIEGARQGERQIDGWLWRKRGRERGMMERDRQMDGYGGSEAGREEGRETDRWYGGSEARGETGGWNERRKRDAERQAASPTFRWCNDWHRRKIQSNITLHVNIYNGMALHPLYSSISP
jgi:hypothetical protein